MGRKKKFENCLIVKDIFANEAHRLGNTEFAVFFRFIDLKSENDRNILRENIQVFQKIFDDAIKELDKEDMKNESNDNPTDESEEKMKK